MPAPQWWLGSAFPFDTVEVCLGMLVCPAGRILRRKSWIVPKKVKEIKKTGVHIESLSGDRWLLYKLETRSPFSLERKHSVYVCGALRACLS